MPQIGSVDARFRLESHDHTGAYITSLPYRNLQGEWMLNDAGCQLRGEIPYRGFSNVTQANFYPAKHEVWLFDNKYSTTDPIFAGPVWDVTASSSSGTINFSSQDALSYLAKRRLRVSKNYNTMSPPDMMADLISYVVAQYSTNIAADVQQYGTGTDSQSFLSADRNKINDLLAALSTLRDKTDYYFRTLNGVHRLQLYGGQLKSRFATALLEYGGRLDGYSLQINAQTICNLYDAIGQSGLISSASDTAKQTEYGQLYCDADLVDQSISTSLAATAAAALKDIKSAKVLPSIVTRKLTPMVDFDFGSQFQIVVDDGWAQVNQTIRAIGWQLTIGQGDKTTTVIYSKDNEGVV